jgi:hypothetical protein
MNIANLDYFQRNIVATDHSHGAHPQAMPGGTDVPVANLDANGWPNSLPAGKTGLRFTFQTPEATGPMDVTFTPGVAATITGFQCTVNSHDFAAGTASVTPNDIQPTGNGWALDFTFTGSSYMTAMSAKPAGDTSTFSANFLAQVAAMTVAGSYIRPLDLTGVNLNQGVALTSTTGTFPTPLITAANRNTLASGDWLANDGTTGGRINDGVPIEFLVAMANATNRNLRLPLPWNASDDYYDATADYVIAHLNSGLTGGYGVANEVWNPGFWVHSQAKYEAEAEGLLSVDSGLASGDRANERNVEKTIHVMDRIKARYVAAGKTNYLRVFEMQNALASYAAALLDYAPPGKTALKNHIDVISSAPYFGNTFGTPLANTTDLQAFFDAGHGEVDTTLALAATIQAAGAARTNDLGNPILYDCYEWGQSFFVSDATTRDLLQRDARMGTLYAYALTQAKAVLGNIALNHYYNAGPNSGFGSWGALEASNEAITSARPKAQALADYA